MLRLKSLGQSLIEADDARLTPAAEILFATALYLIVEAGRPIGREELARLFWPGVSESQAQHGVRQVLYKLRAVGARTTTDRSTLVLAPESYSADYASLLDSQTGAALESLADNVGGAFLPSYHPQLSEEFSAWVERQRDIVHSAMTRVLVAGIGAKKARSDWNRAEQLARLCLAVDPLNEEATLTIAEAAALGGRKAKALSILSEYLDDIGADAKEIRLPAIVLRRRISEAQQEEVTLPRDAPFIGRDAEMAELNRALVNAQNGQGSAYFLWGEPGIGKTRLLDEFTRAAVLRGVRVAKVVCQSHDGRRPLSAFVDLVPGLLALPGALGCSPDSMLHLRRLTSHDPDDARLREQLEHPDAAYENTRRAVVDLLDAVSSESCCIVVIDNVHWLDPQSEHLVKEIREWLTSRHILVALTSRTKSIYSEGISYMNVQPLTRESCNKVASVMAVGLSEEQGDFAEWCVKSAGGNPYYLIELLQHGTRAKGGFSPPASLIRLLHNRVAALSTDGRRLLEVCCVLGKHSTLARIEACVETRRARLLSALSDLETRGLLVLEGDHLLSRHDLLTSVVLKQMTPATRTMLHRFTASLLESEADATQSVSLLWECAEHWVAAADSPKAIRLLRRCGDHLMDVGMPVEAAEVLNRAIDIASTPAEQYAIGAQRVRALVQAEREQESLNVLECLLKLRASIDPEPSTLDEVGWMYMNARWQEGDSPADLLCENVEALASERGSVQDRVRAATWLLAASDNLCDIQLGHRIYDLIRPSLDSQDLAPDVRISLEMIYHCSFGSGTTAVGLAEQLLLHARQHNNTPLAVRYMRHAGEALSSHGNANEAIEAYMEALRMANDMRAPRAKANCIISLAALYLHLGDLDSAEKYMRVATESYRTGGVTLLDGNILSNCSEIALKRNNLQQAQSLLLSALPAISRSRAARSAARKIALEVRIRLARDEEPSAAQLEELQSAFAVSRRSTHQDFAASTVMLALWRVGRDAEARHLARDFVGGFRRDLCGYSSDLLTTLHQLGMLHSESTS